MTLEGKVALVTGGSGFIGGRLVEVLARQYGARVKTLVRGSATAAAGAFRAVAAGAEVVFGSVLDEAVLGEALADVDLVFHCAYGMHGSLAEQRQVTVEGTRRLARIAGAAAVRQFVNLGTVVSYGGNTPPIVPEDHESAKLWAWPYAHDKLDAERALADEARAAGMPHTTLRLGVVYGPYAGVYTVNAIRTLSERRLSLVEGGRGMSAATYVDDVIQAMLRAAVRPGAGERFMIRGPDDVTWRQFYGSYDRMVGKNALVSMSRSEMRAARRGRWTTAARRLVPETLAALKASPEFRRTAGELPGLRSAYQRIGKKLVRPAVPRRSGAWIDDRPVELMPEMMLDYFANTSLFSIDKARSLLGYEPRYDLSRGMALTEQWARWANLLPAPA